MSNAKQNLALVEAVVVVALMLVAALLPDE